MYFIASISRTALTVSSPMPGQLHRLPSTRMIRGVSSGKTVSKCAMKSAFSPSGAAKAVQTTLPASSTCRPGTPQALRRSRQ